jgi:E3 ubiquitin-protein ligase HERC4
LALYKKLLNENVDITDLKDLSPSLAKSLQSILDYDKDDLADVFGVNFEISREYFGENQVIELKENGSNIAVTRENR